MHPAASCKHDYDISSSLWYTTIKRDPSLQQASWAQGLTDNKGGASSQSSGGGSKAAPAVPRNDAAGRHTGPRPPSNPQPSSGSRADGAGNGITNGSGRGGRGRGGRAWGDANGSRAAPAQHADSSPFAAVPTATAPQLGLPSINTQAPQAKAKSSVGIPPQGRPPAAHPPAHIPSLKTQPVAVHAQVICKAHYLPSMQQH